MEMGMGEVRQLRWVAGTWSVGRQDGESVRYLGYGLWNISIIHSANQASRHTVFVQPEIPLEISWNRFPNVIQTSVGAHGQCLCWA